MKAMKTPSLAGARIARRVAETRRALAWAGMLALTAFAPGAAVDAQEGGAPAMGPARYEVEVIVFRHLDQHGNTPEVPAPRPDSPLAGSPVAGSYAPQGSGWPALEPAALALLPSRRDCASRAPTRCSSTAAGFSRSSARTSAVASPLAAETAPSRVRGSITLYRERYLHALVDIGLQAADGTVDDLQRIRQGRRLRGQAIQYFDHPALGVILAARPLDGVVTVEPDTAPVTD